MIMQFGGNFKQVLLLGGCFMLIATASRTTTSIHKTVLESIKREDPSFHADSYTALSIIYAVFAISTWFAPSVVALLGPKRSLIISAIFYVTWTASFLWPKEWLLYLTSVWNGMAAAVLWTAQGSFLSLISNPETSTRNSCIFWAITQCNCLIGNLLIYWQFTGKKIVDEGTRRVVYVSLASVCATGLLSFIFLKDVRQRIDANAEEHRDNSNQDGKSSDANGSGVTAVEQLLPSNKRIPTTATNQPEKSVVFLETIKEGTNDSGSVISFEGSATPLQNIGHPSANCKFDTDLQRGAADNSGNSSLPSPGSQKKCKEHLGKAWLTFKEALILFKTPNMMLLSFTSFYTGIELSFYAGILPTSVAFTEAFGKNSKRLVGLMGVFAGIGAVSSGILFGICGTFTRKKGHTPIIVFGFVLHTTCFILVYLSIPDSASHAPTTELSYLKKPEIGAIMVCAGFLGFGDSCFQTQLIALLATHCSDNPAAAFAIFKFIQSLGAAGSFFLSSYTGLHVKLLILGIMCVLATATFILVEWRVKKSSKGAEVVVVVPEESVVQTPRRRIRSNVILKTTPGISTIAVVLEEGGNERQKTW